MFAFDPAHNVQWNAPHIDVGQIITIPIFKMTRWNTF